MEEATTRCRNCDTPLDGLYCRNCGQREGRGDLHFQEAVTDILGDVFTWDSRVWRTLVSLLFRPGFLSAEFNAGRRVRYLPPFRLYLIVSFVLFLTLSLMTDYVVDFGDASDDAVEVSISLDSEDEATADEPESAQSEVAEAPSSLTEALQARIDAKAPLVRDDPGGYVRELLEYLPQVMFLMLPVFALLLKLAYLFSSFHYLQHLVFALHYHTFVYLLYLASLALEQIAMYVDGIVALPLLIYLPMALRRSYASSWPGALGKSLFLMLSYGAALVLGMAAAAVAVLVTM